MINSSFSKDKYGLIVRTCRKNAGYKSVDMLADEIEHKLGCRVEAKTLYRIETGKQSPCMDDLVAVNKTLFGEAFPPFLESCLS